MIGHDRRHPRDQCGLHQPEVRCLCGGRGRIAAPPVPRRDRQHAGRSAFHRQRRRRQAAGGARMGRGPRDRPQGRAAFRHHLAGSQSRGHEGGGGGSPRGARRHALRGADADRGRRAGLPRIPGGDGAVAPGFQRAWRPGARRGVPGPATGRLLRQFVPSHDAGGGADLRAAAGRARCGCAPLGLSRHLLRLHQPAGAEIRAARRGG